MNHSKSKQAAIFLDRDGTINMDKGYFYRPENLNLKRVLLKQFVC